MVQLSCCDITYGPQSQQYLPSDLLQKKIANPSHRWKEVTCRVKDKLYGVNICRQRKTVTPQVKVKVDEVNKPDFIESKEEGFGI